MTDGEKRVQIEINDYIKIEIIGYVKTPPNSNCWMHKHPFWELIYSKEGEGRYQIGEDEISLESDEVCLIAPDVLHDCRNVKDTENVKLYIGFSYRYSFHTDIWKDRQYLLIQSMWIAGIKEQLGKLCGLLEKGEANMENIIIGDIITLIAQIVRYISSEKASGLKIADIKKQNLAELVKEYLGNNLCRTIKLDELGDTFYLSSHYIGDTFKKITGMSIKRYHDMLRMRYAYQLLVETDLSVSEISVKLGYESIHYFSRRFKERYSLSPSRLRKK